MARASRITYEPPPLFTVFGMLMVTGSPYVKGRDHARVQCTCECGGAYHAEVVRLIRGLAKSCNANRHAPPTFKHGAAKRGDNSPEYVVWQNMRRRCYDPKNTAFGDYGGRGITVCDRWLESFENFYADMGARPKGKSLERKNNNLGYSKDNCKWADATEQARNKRNVKLIEFNGERMSLPAWAERIGVSKFSLRNRIYIYGWPIEVALTRPIMPGVHLGQSQPPKLVIMLPLEIVAAADTFAKKVTKSLL